MLSHLSGEQYCETHLNMEQNRTQIKEKSLAGAQFLSSHSIPEVADVMAVRLFLLLFV